MSIKKIVPLVSLLTIFGFGCAKQTTNVNIVPSPSPVPVVTEPTPIVNTVQPEVLPSPVASSTTQFTIDESWKMYTNKALGFHLQTPTKGGYTPEWEVKFYKENDPAVKDGCVTAEYSQQGSSQKSSVQGVEFCHTSYSDGAAGSMYLIDYFSTKKGGQYIAVIFTKRLTSAGALGCAFTQTSYSLSATSCVAYEAGSYQELLKIIISTFKYN